MHHMLAAGEVKELIIRPDMEMVTIILHDGAIVKSRKVSSTIFHMSVADVSKFEEKLRDVEKRLGISDGELCINMPLYICVTFWKLHLGVPVTYDRQSDVTGRILLLLLFVGLLMAFSSRMRGMKSPLSMDSFVSKISNIG